MSEKSLPEVGKPYSTGDGFAIWRPQLTTLSVVPCGEGLEIVVSQPGVPTLFFPFTPAQRDELVSLLIAAAPADCADAGEQAKAIQRFHVGSLATPEQLKAAIRAGSTRRTPQA
jgi:hypothetical protein